MQASLKKASSVNTGYIVWLKLSHNGTLLKDLTANLVIPSNSKSIADNLSKTAKRVLNDTRIIKPVDDPSKCTFDSYVLSQYERNYLTNLENAPTLQMDEMKRNEVYHILPLHTIQTNENAVKVNIYTYNYTQY